jgi:hypothetical protein
MIKPTVSRKVWFWQHEPIGGYADSQPEDATVVYVHSDSLVNLRVTNHSGEARPETSVFLWDGESAQPDTRHAQWMPYQIGQAKKEEVKSATGEVHG